LLSAKWTLGTFALVAVIYVANSIYNGRTIHEADLKIAESLRRTMGTAPSESDDQSAKHAADAPLTLTYAPRILQAFPRAVLFRSDLHWLRRVCYRAHVLAHALPPVQAIRRAVAAISSAIRHVDAERCL